MTLRALYISPYLNLDHRREHLEEGTVVDGGRVGSGGGSGLLRGEQVRGLGARLGDDQPGVVVIRDPLELGTDG